MVIPALVIMIGAQRGKRVGAGQWGAFALLFVAVAAGVNWPVFSHLDIFTHSVGRETTLLAQGEKSYTGGQVAFFEYIHMFLNNTNPAVWLLLPAALVAQWKRRDLFEWMMAVFPFAFMLLLSCSAKTNDRYFLPASAGFYYLAALGALDLGEILPAKVGGILRPVVVGAVAVIANVVFLAPYVASFGHDDRAEMLGWIKANVPPGAVIAAENHADMPVARRPERLAVQPLLTQRVIETKYAAELGTVPSALPGAGIQYIIVSESDYGIFLRKAAVHLSPGLEAKREFYETLFRDYRPVWERGRGTGIYLHPGLRIYRLSGA
jgi:hypothetical protein